MMIDHPAPDQVPALKSLWAKCFPDPERFIDGFFDTAFSDRRCRCMVEAGETLAALYWLDAEYLGQKMAYIYAVATDPDHRGRGLCRRLMADAHVLLTAQGYAAALLLPGEPGLREMYRKMGYQDCCSISGFSCEAGEKIPVEEVCWQEYAALRPFFLPENGALQDGLAFLATYAKFYLGEKFLLAAVTEGENFAGLELLGDREAAPGILAALGHEKGTFRTPGKAVPGAMYLPLKESVEAPGYFGLTFD